MSRKTLIEETKKRNNDLFSRSLALMGAKDGMEYADFPPMNEKAWKRVKAFLDPHGLVLLSESTHEYRGGLVERRGQVFVKDGGLKALETALIYDVSWDEYFHE